MKTRVGGAWRNIASGKVRVGSSWRSLTAIRTYSGGEWRLVANFAGAVNLTLVPDTISKTGANSLITTASVQATPAGGLAPFTYTWSQVDGDSMSATAPSSASCAFSATGMTSGETRTAQFRCTCVDSIGSTSSDDVSVTITRT
jgi:hypothetical protein